MDIDREEYFNNDELKIYRGEDFVVSKHIVLHQPTLGEICDYSERKYYSMVYSFTATPQSMKAQLWQAGVDYTTINPYQLFLNFYKTFDKTATSIIFKNLDFSKFELKQTTEGNIVLYQVIDGNPVVVDEYTYGLIVDYLSKVHFIERDLKNPMNESTKMILIEDAMDELRAASQKPYHSQLKNLISAMVNSEGFKYNHSQVWDMKINAFMDSVKRIQSIKNANLLLQSAYSGFGINMKDIDKKQLDWLGELT